jgi:hypothetical protein
MTSRAIYLHVNPSDETIRLGPLAVRFLITGEHATGSVAVFELSVPSTTRRVDLRSPAEGAIGRCGPL